MEMRPEISVIMPVYNYDQFVGQAIESIINQTFENWELIIIEDASSDNTWGVIMKFKDKRIKLIRNRFNLGNYRSRNIGLSIAKGNFLCVMDADDISLPERFSTQLGFLKTNSEYGLIGSSYQLINDQNLYLGHSVNLNDFEKIKVFLLKNNCFCHSTVMLKKANVDKYKLNYNEQYYYASDYDFIFKASRLFKITNLPEMLVKYRKHPEQITCLRRNQQIYFADMIRLSQLKVFNLRATNNEVVIHNKVMKSEKINDEELRIAIHWFNKLIEQNRKLNLYRPDYLESFFRFLLNQSLQ